MDNVIVNNPLFFASFLFFVGLVGLNSRLITIRYTAPFENVFWKRDAMKPIGQKIVKLMLDMNFDANPIIIHVFSNGGAYLYQHIDLAIKEYQVPLDVSHFSTGNQSILCFFFRRVDFLHSTIGHCFVLDLWRHI